MSLLVLLAVAGCDYPVQAQVIRARAPVVFQQQAACAGCAVEVQSAPVYQVQAAPAFQVQQQVFAAPVYSAPVVVRQQAVYSAPVFQQQVVYGQQQFSVVGKSRSFAPVRSRGVVVRGRTRGRASVGVARQAVEGGGGVNINAAAGAKVKVK